MEKPLIFNPTGNDSVANRQMFFGNSTNLFNLNDVKFQWTTPLRKKMREDFWIAEKVDLTADIVQYKELTNNERRAFNGILSYLTFLDSIQENNLPEISRYITAPEIKSCLAQQLQQEDEHNKAYQVMIETLIPQEEREKVYELWREDPILLERCQFIANLYQQSIDANTDEEYFYGLFADYLLEGLYFYAGFQLFYTLSSRQLMQGSADMIQYINIDEEAHCKLFSEIIKEALTIFPHSKEKLYKMANEAVNQEIRWANHIIGNDFLGITEHSTDRYCKWLINGRLKTIGLNPIYDTEKYKINPYKHLEKANQGTKGENVKANFFESTVVAYSQSSSVQGWDKF